MKKTFKKIITILVVLTFFLAPSISSASTPIVFGAAGTRIASFSPASTASGSSPSVSGNNVVAFATMGWDGSNTITTVTWGGVTMTKLVAASSTAGGAIISGQSVYYLPNPPAGVSTVTVTASANWGGFFSSMYYFTGVNQTSPIVDATTNSSTASTSYNDTINTTADNLYVMDNVVQQLSGATFTLSSPSIRIQQGSDATGTIWECAYQGNINFPGTVTIARTSPLTNSWLSGIFSIRPANVSNFFFMF